MEMSTSEEGRPQKKFEEEKQGKKASQEDDERCLVLAAFMMCRYILAACVCAVPIYGHDGFRRFVSSLSLFFTPQPSSYTNIIIMMHHASCWHPSYNIMHYGQIIFSVLLLANNH